jgi:mannose-6-phosphate isomerase-like protein (cupin superfamily)/CDGSH-type Zn-finger protein
MIARTKPYLVALEKGRTYWWCSCGRSKRQPYCDGSHQGTGFEPLRHVAATDGEEVLFCGCKHTRTPPFCDGAHANLPGGYTLDDPDSAANRAVPLVPDSPDGRTMLDGGCYVFSPSRAPLERRGALAWSTVISDVHGAKYQSQYYLRVDAGRESAPVGFGDRETILFVASGQGTVRIAGRPLAVEATDGVYVRPGEAFTLEAGPSAPLEVFASACPFGPIGFPDGLGTFDETTPERVVQVDRANRTAMGPRWFQLLVDKRIGSKVITQFIGHIPQSKASAHRHLYEEALIILTGHGCMWTEGRRANVRAGDVIFLPRKQEHSLQSSAPEGMDVVGVIYPGDNPGINY